jgi:hypothetical protein
MKKLLAVFLLIILNVFSFNNLQAQQFTFIFSISDLEKYLGEPVPGNAQQRDSDYWIIGLFNNNSIREDIWLLSENNIVIAAEYSFASHSKSWMSGIHEFISHTIDENGENKRTSRDAINWDIKPDSGLKNNKKLLIGITDVYSRGNRNNEAWAFSVRILDLDLRERQRIR